MFVCETKYSTIFFCEFIIIVFIYVTIYGKSYTTKKKNAQLQQLNPYVANCDSWKKKMMYPYESDK